jgi:hypothetical protein
VKLPIVRVAGFSDDDGDLDGFVQDANGEWFAFGMLDWDCSITRVSGLARRAA